MMEFIKQLKTRNGTLSYFSAFLFVLSILFYLLTTLILTQVAGISAWLKSFKFVISIAIYCRAMACYFYELPSFNIELFNGTNIMLFSFVIIYIAVHAARVQESHYNTTTPFYSFMFACMGVAAILITLYTADIGLKFLQSDLPNPPDYYVNAIRFSIVLFIVFFLRGLLTDGSQTHTRHRDTNKPFTSTEVEYERRGSEDSSFYWHTCPAGYSDTICLYFKEYEARLCA